MINHRRGVMSQSKMFGSRAERRTANREAWAVAGAAHPHFLTGKNYQYRNFKRKVNQAQSDARSGYPGAGAVTHNTNLNIKGRIDLRGLKNGDR